MTTTGPETDRDDVVERLVEHFDHHDPALDHEVLEGLYQRFAGCPVVHSEAHGGFEVVTGYDEIFEIEKTCSVFSSAHGVLHPDAEGHTPAIPIEFDPPIHTSYRKLFMDILSAPRVRRIEPFLRSLSDRVLDEYLAGDDPDFVQHVAVQIPIRAVGNLLGLGEEESERIQDFGETILEHFGQPAMIEALQALMAFSKVTFDDRRANPRDDYLTRLLDAEVDGRKLDDAELFNIVRTFFFAGFETTGRAIGSLVHHLATHPELQEQVRTDHDVLNNVVEEGLRLFPPVTNMFRTVAEPVDLAGEALQPGDKLTLLYGAANRDPKHFTDADEFRADRENARSHLTFGIGTHYCAGAPLARAELRILLEALAERPPYELVGEPQWAPHLMMGQMMGVTYLPLRFAAG